MNRDHQPVGRPEHWERVYGTKAADRVSWFRPHLETSIALIESAAPDKSASIIDVGGGACTLADDLLGRGYTNLTVLDISESAIELAKKRLGRTSESVRWVHADVSEASLPVRVYDVWHDRAVFHFLIDREQRLRYVARVQSAVRVGGHIIVSTFGPEGPARCSGLDVMRYDADQLHSEFGSRFRTVECSTEWHQTPSGTTQQFLYCHFVLES
ncbi:MAG TPA: class I SAM-dependent methyltransferase [Silvibacterium sp.]|nr:class I SAM-dependent methyltransferase [Silvibacterium sp.]